MVNWSHRYIPDSVSIQVRSGAGQAAGRGGTRGPATRRPSFPDGCCGGQKEQAALVATSILFNQSYLKYCHFHVILFVFAVSLQDPNPACVSSTLPSDHPWPRCRGHAGLEAAERMTQEASH